jgi:hypothetical protein
VKTLKEKCPLRVFQFKALVTPHVPRALKFRGREVRKMSERENQIEHPIHRVIALLNRSQVDYLDKVGKDALFSTGNKLHRTQIISCLVDLIREAGINGEDVKTEEGLKQKILLVLAKAVSRQEETLVH